MKKAFSLICGLIAVMLFYGCGTTELERTPYGQDELRWEGYIKSNYRAWTPPQTVPPSSSEEPVSAADIPALPPLPEMQIQQQPQTPGVTTIPQHTPASTPEKYTVSKGDTLWGISKKVYGKGEHWQKIYNANKSKISDPNKLKAGIVLDIPPAN